MKLIIGAVYEFKSTGTHTDFGVNIGNYYYAGHDYYLFEQIEDDANFGNTYDYMIITINNGYTKYKEHVKLIETYYFNNPPKGKRYVSRIKADIELESNKDWLLTQVKYAYDK